MKQLRFWQKECIEKALQKYKRGRPHFLCVATPGAGKTIMASVLASKLLENKQIDLVICFSPSVAVSVDFRKELEKTTGFAIDGLIGSKGSCLTYHAMLHVPESFWALFRRFRVFAIFDEIHHCAGDGETDGNAWGNQIMANIQGLATFTLALSGTPWRSDGCPVTLLRYSKQGTIRIDYEYGLSRAISEGVCKSPVITLIDNQSIFFKSRNSQSRHSSIKALMEQESVSYYDILVTKDIIRHTLGVAQRKLQLLRRAHPRAGGLIVCATIAHAYNVQNILEEITGDAADVVTSLSDNAHEIIGNFRIGSTPWIISVGMISEGTNIPRLTVCVHLSRIRTELYFRQVLGRILRKEGADIENGFLYVPADETMEQHAGALMTELPALKNNVCRATINVDNERDLESEAPTAIRSNDQNNQEISYEIALNDGAPLKILEKNYTATIKFGADFITRDIHYPL